MPMFSTYHDFKRFDMENHLPFLSIYYLLPVIFHILQY